MTDARERLAQHRRVARTLAESLASGATDDWEPLRALQPGASRKSFANTCNALGFLGGAAVAGRSDMVEWLLAAGADPNHYVGHCHEIRRWCDFPLHLVSAAPQDERTLRCIEQLLRAGASIGQVSPPEDLVRTPLWRYSALDAAIRAMQPGAVDALLPHADPATCEAALVTAILATKIHEADRRWLLSVIARLPVAPVATRFGMHALHAAALVGDLEVWDAVAARAGGSLNPGVAVEQSFRENWLPGAGSGMPTVGLRLGATPLDVVDAVRRLARAGLAALEGGGRKRDAAWETWRDGCIARLGALDELERRIRAGGGVSGVDGLPAAVAEVERELSRIAEALGTLDRWRVAVAAVDLAGKGPLGFLVMVSELARAAFAGLKRADAHLLGAFLTGRLPATVVLGRDVEPEHRGEFSADQLVWARDYPRAARPLFELAYRYPSALLGRDGDAILGATLEEGGTMLWRVTRRSVEKLGDVRAWIREGVEVLLREGVADP